MPHPCCCLTQDLVEGGVVDRPRWLGMSVHLFNTATVWLDLLLAYPRTFSKRSQHLSLSLVLAYVVWILVCSHFNGFFPYPFLNKLPWPQVGASRMHAPSSEQDLVKGYSALH